MWNGFAIDQNLEQFALFNLLGPLYTDLYTQRVTADQQGLRLVTANPRMEQCGHRMKPRGEPPCLKKKKREKEAVDMGAEGVHPGHESTDEVPFEDKPSESAPSAPEYPAASSRTTTTLPATNPATSSPIATSPMAESLGFTGVPYPTYGVDSFAAAPPMATAVSEPVASSSTYVSIRESMPRRYADDYHRTATGVYMTGIPGYAAPETGYTMPTPGFTSLSGLHGPQSCGGRILKQVPDAVADTRSSSRSHCRPSG